MDNERLELLGQIASWYYEDNLDQSVIAQQIGRSRSMVSRMLQEARQHNIVEINVNYPLKTDLELATQLCKQFDLTQAFVLTTAYPLDKKSLMRRLGALAARYIQTHLQATTIIGLGWGTAIHETIQSIITTSLKEAMVLQIVGTVGHNIPIADGANLVRRLAAKLGSHYRALSAPLIVRDADTAIALRQDHSIAETLKLANQADITLVGIGTMVKEDCTLYHTQYIDDHDWENLNQAGAVGDMLAYHFDIHGTLVDTPLNDCIIGQPLMALRQLPLVIAVAGGEAKVPAILGALQTGCLNVLVTDAKTASAVLTLYNKTK